MDVTTWHQAGRTRKPANKFSTSVVERLDWEKLTWSPVEAKNSNHAYQIDAPGKNVKRSGSPFGMQLCLRPLRASISVEIGSRCTWTYLFCGSIVSLRPEDRITLESLTARSSGR